MRKYRPEPEPKLEEPSIFLWMLFILMALIFILTVVAGTMQLLDQLL